MAKVLHIHFSGSVDQSDPNSEEVQVKCDCKIIETGFTSKNYTIYPQVALRTLLGALKPAESLNSELQTEVIAYLARVHEESGFDDIFLTGAY